METLIRRERSLGVNEYEICDHLICAKGVYKE